MTTQGSLDILITRILLGASSGTSPFGQPIPGAETALRVWARREDFRARDFVRSADFGLVTVQDSRYRVRYDPVNPWAEGDTFTDEEGVTRRVEGVGRLGRNDFLELLARRIG